MEKRLVTFIACLFLSLGMALAQTRVTGTVVSAEDGEPVIGASIKVLGTNTGTVTDADGNFQLNVAKGAELEISYIGMETKRVAVKGNTLNIRLENGDHSLDEVMVVAYGTEKKSAFTGSAAVVGSDEIGKVQVTNPVDALKGKASGVQIYTASGAPGSTPTIRIRGVNSIEAGKDPLIVVDGSPYDGSLNDINPIDVESMTVLKDAASTALYGARGGNGVILITTKSAKKGKDATITFDAKWGSNSRATPFYKTINTTAGYYEAWYNGLYNYAQNSFGYDSTQAWQWANNHLIEAGQAQLSYGLGYNVYTVPDGQMLIGQNGKLNPNATLGSYVTNNGTTYFLTPDNWQDATYNNSLRQEYTFSASGSTDKSNFYASVNYLSNDGITVASDYKRLTARLNADYQAKSWLKLGGNMSYAHYNRNYLGNDGAGANTGNVFSTTYIAPIYPIYLRDAAGNIIYNEDAKINSYDYGDGKVNGLVRPYMNGGNPLSDNLVNENNTEGNVLNATGTAEVRLPYGFKFTSINNVYLNEFRYTNAVNPWFGQYANNGGTISKEHDRTWSFNYQQRVNWHQTYGKHDVEVMVGHEYYRSRGYWLTNSMSKVFSFENHELAGAIIPQGGTSYTSDYNTESWLSRAQYNYSEKYFFSGSYLRQASSRFHPDHRWGNFWSVGGGWLINKESWFHAPWVDELKLKASYGENGNDQITDCLYTTYYSVTNSNDEISLVPASLGNENITWEKNGKFNAGVDFSLFNGRLSGSAEFYFNKTIDMLSWLPLPTSFGWTGYYTNIGNVINRGVEVNLSGDVIRTKDLTWSLYANFTTNHNEVTKLAPERKLNYVDGVEGFASGTNFYGEGVSIYTFYLPKYAGVYYNEENPNDPDNGKAQYYRNVYKVDENGNQVLDAKGHPIVTGRETTTVYSEADQYLCGDALPDVYGGFGTSLSWKGFDFSVDFTYQLGGLVYDSTYAGLMNLTQGYGIHVDMLNAWSLNNTGSNIPRMQFNDVNMASSSDRFLTSASYLSLQNVTIGYTLPKSWTSKIGLQGLRFYVVGDNLWTWSKRQGLDPRQSITGSASADHYSSVRTISGGLTVTF